MDDTVMFGSLETSLGMLSLIELSNDNFDAEITRAELPALVEFSAPWCPPCRLIEPSLKKLAEAYAGRVRVAKIDTDLYPELAVRWGVMSLPTLLLIKQGRVLGQIVGAVPHARIEELVKTGL